MLGMCGGIEVLSGFGVERLLFWGRRGCCLCLGLRRGLLVVGESSPIEFHFDLGCGC